jgi:pimeloyl-ACP methyl ester carboxylesterase
VPSVSDHHSELDGLPIFWRSAPAPSEATPTPGSTPASAPTSAPAPIPLYLHGVPTNSDDWISPRASYRVRPWWKRWWRPRRDDDDWMEPPPYELGFLERSGGVAVDLPGFGRSGKPGNLQYTIDEYAEFVERFLDHLEIERISLVVHDWGAVGLAFAQRHPERVARLVAINVVPFLPGFRWHRIARLWRTPLLGELFMGSTGRQTLRYASRESNATPGPLPEEWVDTVLDHFDQGTQRAILRLYRSSPADVLAAAGAELARLTMPALVVWGTQDSYISVSFGRELARVLPNAELLELPDAGHVPWLDRPDLIGRVTEFLAAT